MPWIRPNNHTLATGWSDPANAYDGTEVTDATNTAANYNNYLQMSLAAATWCSKLRLYSQDIDPPNPVAGADVTIDIYYDDDWHECFNGQATAGEYYEIDLGLARQISWVRIKSNSGDYDLLLYDIGLWQVDIETVDIRVTDELGRSAAAVTVTCSRDGVEQFSETTDAGGQITQQTIESGQSYNFTFSKTGFRDYEINGVTIDAATDWIISHLFYPSIGTDLGEVARIEQWIVDTLAALTDDNNKAIFKTVEIWKHQVAATKAGFEAFGRHAPFAFPSYDYTDGAREGDYDLRQAFVFSIMIGNTSKADGIARTGNANKIGTLKMRDLVIAALDHKHPGAGFDCDDLHYLRDIEIVDMPKTHALQMQFRCNLI